MVPPKMSESAVQGLIEFPQSLFCFSDSIGQTVDIEIAGRKGVLILPSLPEWEPEESDPLRKWLLAPPKAKKWKRGEKPIFWGRPTSYPTVCADIERAYVEFDCDADSRDSVAQDIYLEFPKWYELFDDYVVLLSKQRTRREANIGQGRERIELYFDGGEELQRISPSQPITLTAYVSSGTDALRLSQFQQAAFLSSRSLPPRLEYRLLLQAYVARNTADHRKAIIEAANALEVALTSRITEEFRRQEIAFGDALMKKFRMLGGRFELARAMNISLPDINYTELVVTPRNEVIHRSRFPDMNLVNQAIAAVEQLLEVLSPNLEQDDPR